MHRVTVLCLDADRDAALERLRDLGVLHLRHVHPPEHASVDRARRDLEYVERAMEILPHNPHTAPSGKSAVQIVKSLWKLMHARQELDSEAETLRHEEMRIAPFGSFDPAAVAELAGKGIHVRLFRIDPKQEPSAPGGAVLQVLSRTKNATYFAVIGREATEIEGQQVRPPEHSLDALRARLAAIREEHARLDEQIEAFGGDYPIVAEMRADAADRVHFLEARAGMGASSRVCYLQGYTPVDAEPRLREAAADGWGLLIEEPAEDEPVPTLIRNPRWVAPIQAMFKVIGILPGYGEIDISAVFLLFLSLFFAMLVGDAGYGLLFLGLTAFGRLKFRKAPPQMFALLTIMSVCTIVWGVLTGNYFGLAHVPAPLAAVKIPWLTDQHADDNIMQLCFLIGAVQLTIAHLWNAYRQRSGLSALAQLGWIASTWTMYFLACMMVLGYAFPHFMVPILIVGVVAIVLFMTPVRRLKSEWFNHVMLPLSLVSNFVDVVSYVRLFAVGAASYAVASAFNTMGHGLAHGFLGGLAAALVIFAGHALNIMLAAMAVLVHGVRLNTLEFSSHLGMQWSGIPYRPFTRLARAAGTEKSK